MNRKKQLLIGITVTFFLTMAILTVTARGIHNALIPHVTVEIPGKRDFSIPYTDEAGKEGTTIRKRLAISETAAGADSIYVLYEAQKNGEYRTFVKAVQVEVGMRENGYVEVLSGVSREDRLVISSDRPLWDGAEVWVESSAAGWEAVILVYQL